ncbi:MAG: adenylyltransferase/cytidyltransferase family protein [Planctomycetota bacterium]|nr:adenylyltransferase/cytidyltransferase family protein [Planctomycetota bacterium]
MSEQPYDVMILSGGFCPLHLGHIRMIKAARAQAALVVVGLNSDGWIQERKGKCPLPLEERLEILAAVRGVTSAVRFDDSDGTAIDLMRRVRAVSGPDSKIAFGNGGPRTEENVPEIDVCRELHIDLVWNVGGTEDLEPKRPLAHF